ncbi:MAG TPA: YhdH/YhfP family quinone oxidoreductase [Acidimicrobiales bacterium]|nr:YhdH/YhfP family quinone oxidoreductase [Acidimicrobiales bacterium]
MRAYVIDETTDFSTSVRDVELHALEPSDVLVEVDYSGINFKDAMVSQSKSRVRRRDVLIGGVDAAGVVVASTSERTPPGTRVALHGGALGVARDGGFAEFIYAPPANVSPLPDTISTRDAMVIGTAGFTAMQSILALEDHGLARGARVLVTGATGGVGSQSVTYLAARGYQPVASTGSQHEHAWLRARGAVEVIGRDAIADRPDRVLASEAWDGAIDCVGGDALHQILRSLRYGAAVAASGLVASAELTTSVYPFITRGVALLGIDSVEVGTATRARVWRELGALAHLVDFDALIDHTTSLEALNDALAAVRAGTLRGRVLVDPRQHV